MPFPIRPSIRVDLSAMSWLLALLPGAISAQCIAADLTVFGFELGKPLALPECPIGASIPGRKMYRQIPEQTCFQEAHKMNGYGVPIRTVVFGKSEAPPIVSYWRFDAIERDGLLIGVRFKTFGVGSQDVVMAQLRNKYGAPTSVSTEPVSNLAGARFDSVTALWRGAGVNVTYYGTLSKLDEGQVTIDLPEADALRHSWEHAETAGERKL